MHRCRGFEQPEICFACSVNLLLNILVFWESATKKDSAWRVKPIRVAALTIATAFYAMLSSVWIRSDISSTRSGAPYSAQKKNKLYQYATNCTGLQLDNDSNIWSLNHTTPVYRVFCQRLTATCCVVKACSWLISWQSASSFHCRGCTQSCTSAKPKQFRRHGEYNWRNDGGRKLPDARRPGDEQSQQQHGITGYL